MKRSLRKRGGVEWPTVAVAVMIYGSWLTLVLSHGQLRWWLTLPLLAIVLAWHGSLQHEVLHGHPFRNQAANDALGSVPLSLRLPYPVYRRYHLEHHEATYLTDPLDDSESYYRTADTWSHTSRRGRWVATVHQTLVGRMILGPILDTIGVWLRQLREIRHGERRLAQMWAQHALLVAAFALLVFGVIGMPIWTYLLAVYVGHGLSLVRSFCEHRWMPGSASRSAVVRSGRFFSLLFLNNNLHHTHHARPGAAWYRLPALANELHSDQAAASGAGLYHGYRDVARRYAVHPVNEIVHPIHR